MQLQPPTNCNPLTLALVGLGSAGRSRLQAIENNNEFKLSALVSRRPGIGDQSWSEVLQNPQIEAVAISTENSDHPNRVRQALAARKHVLCDYPLCFSAETAAQLYALAKTRAKILHVEHIALLSEEHVQVKTALQTLGTPQRGDYRFQGGWNEKLFDPSHSGPYPFLAVSRLVQIADWFGPFEIEPRRFKVDAKHFLLHLHLKFPENGVLGFTEERRQGLPRSRSLQVEGSAGNFSWRGGTLQGGLFAKDLQWFHNRVVSGQACYYDEALMVRILGALEQIR